MSHQTCKRLAAVGMVVVWIAWGCTPACAAGIAKRAALGVETSIADAQEEDVFGLWDALGLLGLVALVRHQRHEDGRRSQGIRMSFTGAAARPLELRSGRSRRTRGASSGEVATSHSTCCSRLRCR